MGSAGNGATITIIIIITTIIMIIIVTIVTIITIITIIMTIRLDILRRRKDNLLEAPQSSSSRKTTEGGRTRASFVEYVSEV